MARHMNGLEMKIQVSSTIFFYVKFVFVVIFRQCLLLRFSCPEYNLAQNPACYPAYTRSTPCTLIVPVLEVI